MQVTNTNTASTKQNTENNVVYLSSTFDVSLHNILTMKFEKLGIKNIAWEWFRKYLSGCKQNIEIVPDNKSRNIPEVVIVRRRVGGVLGIWEGWVNWVKGGANGVSLQAT